MDYNPQSCPSFLKLKLSLDQGFGLPIHRHSPVSNKRVGTNKHVGWKITTDEINVYGQINVYSGHNLKTE